MAKKKKKKKNQSGTKSKVLRKGHSKKYYRGLGKDSSRNKAVVPGEKWARNAGKDTAKVVLRKGAGRDMTKGSTQEQYNKGLRKGHSQELGKEPSKGFCIRLNKSV